MADIMTTLTSSSAACDSTPQSSAQALRQNLARSGRKLLRNPLAVAGLVVILALLLLAIFAPLVATHDPLLQDLNNTLKAPSSAKTESIGPRWWSNRTRGWRRT